VQRWARAWFVGQAICGTAWWVLVAVDRDVRRLTLGGWDPRIVAGPDLLLFCGAALWAGARGSSLAATAAAGWSVLVTVALAGYALLERQAGWGVVLMTTASIGAVVAASIIVRGSVPTGWFFAGPFRFRPAPPRSATSNAAHSLAQLVVFWSFFFGVVPVVLMAIEERIRIDAPALQHVAIERVAVVVLVAASTLGLWSCLTMAVRGAGTPLPSATGRELVVAGPYRHVRNPMAVAGALQTAAVGAILGSWITIAAAVVGAVAWHLLIRPEEERDLAARFGADYERYRDRVRCWVPRYGAR